jgi:serine/threonine protein kinase
MTACNVGTPQYMAPELCTNQIKVWEKFEQMPKDQNRSEAMKSYMVFQEKHEHIAYSGQQVDVYAFAVTMCEFLTHEPPFRGLSASAAMVHVHRGGRPAVPSEHEVAEPEGWRELMIEAWDQSPSKRPEFTVIAERIAAIEERLRAQPQATVTFVSDRVPPPSMGSSGDGMAVSMAVVHSADSNHQSSSPPGSARGNATAHAQAGAPRRHTVSV